MNAKLTTRIAVASPRQHVGDRQVHTRRLHPAQPTVANGPDALRQLVESPRASNPDGRNVIEHVAALGDLVLLESNAGVSATSKGAAIVDVFRVQDGKIAERWDTIQGDQTPR
ncbi:nuclear transport factor 2 family protein [Streptomyces sp. NPDC093544]|jgi:predicted SnoaL-like aldol condensation-catalyzing enzyme|uniref:nuclear transport factor 2 family protein n=1 Tax=Streptomyces sp. NPDC093544 TaxID=3155200 RepID=UPI00343DC349